MTFEQWLRTDGPLLAALGVTPVERRQMKSAWDAAIEAAARVCEARGDKIGGAIDPHITAKDVRALSTNETPNV